MRDTAETRASSNAQQAQRRRKATVVLLTLTLVLLACVQGMLVMFAQKDRARLAQIRELTRRISAERELPEADRMLIHRSAPSRMPEQEQVVSEEAALRERIRESLPDGSAPQETPPVGSPRAGLGHLVDLANFIAHERRASLVEWRGRLAILYQKLDPEAQDPLWEILNVLSDLKLVDTVTVVAAERDLPRAKELRDALAEFGIAPDRLKIGRKAEHGEVFTGVLIATSAGV